MRRIALTLFLLAAGPAMADCPSPPDLHDGWAVSRAADQGLDAELICAIGPRFDAWTEVNAHSIVIIRHGVLVYEHYMAGEDEAWGRDLGRVQYAADMPHDLRSITKSLVALLVGIAIERGEIAGLDAPVFGFFPEYADLRTPANESLSVRHLLSMSAGIAWDEDLPYADPRNSESQMTRAPDRYRYALAQRQIRAPGEVYIYSGGNTALLEAILRKVSGKPIDVLAQERLFAPLGISDVTWARYADGSPIAASGSRMRPRDLAKIGQLVLSHGAWNGVQVVPAAFARQAISPQINGEGLFFYGFGFWLGRSFVRGQEVTWPAGFGYGGQRMFILPAQDMVVLVHAGLYGGPVFQGLPGIVTLNRYALPAAISPRP